MLRHDFGDLGRTTGGDGASAAGWVVAEPDPTTDDESAELMVAWSVERGRAVEAELLLARVRDLLVRLASANRLPPAAARLRASRLVRVIDNQLAVARDAGA